MSVLSVWLYLTKKEVCSCFFPNARISRKKEVQSVAVIKLMGCVLLYLNRENPNRPWLGRLVYFPNRTQGSERLTMARLDHQSPSLRGPPRSKRPWKPWRSNGFLSQTLVFLQRI